MAYKSNIIKLLTIAASLSLGLASCMYAPITHQGKKISPQQMQTLKLHMSKQDVRKLIGSPVIMPSHQQNQWTYVNAQNTIYSNINQHLILTFNRHNKLIKIETRSHQHHQG